MIEKYKIYLNILNEKLAKFFNSQKDYIFCKEGCSHCCKNSAFPYSKVEFDYLKQGFEAFDEINKQAVFRQVEELKNQKLNSNLGDDFVYDCPFLINEKCSVYEHRGIICRTFGLPYFTDEGKIKTPFCVNMGLNYSSVYDEKTKTFSSEMFEKTGFEQEPLSFNLSLKYLLNNEAVKYLELNFGENKALIDWFN